MSTILIFSALIAATVLCGGCAPREAKARIEPKNLESATHPQWDWEFYPATSQMRLGTLPCQLQPKSTMTVLSPLAGMLRVYTTSPQINLTAGFLWAEFEPEIFAAEEKWLEESRRKLEDQEKLQWEIEYPKKKMQLKQQIEEAERTVNYLRYLSTNPAMAELVLNIGNKATSPLRPEALNDAELALQLSQRTSEYLESTNFAAVGVDLAGQRSEWERRKLDYQRRRAQSRFEMPFDGKLTVSIPLAPGVTNYPVNVGTELGVARDVSAVRMRVVMENVSWTALPTERLRAVVRTAGKPLEARFAYQKIERNQNREEAASYFEFPPDKAGAAAQLIGANVSCELWYDLEEPVRIVPKLSIVMHNPEAFQNRNWAAALSSTFPGARLVIEGQTELGIALPAGIQISSAR